MAMPSGSDGSGRAANGADSSAATPSPMIVYDREGELHLREKSFFGSTRWQKYYVVLCRLRRCLLLFVDYWAYERHLVELNGYDNDYQSWKLRLPLHHSSAFVCSAYFSRPHVFEIDSPDGIFYLRAPSEQALREWLISLAHAGTRLKSDEKPLLLYRPPGLDCFMFTRASSTLPAHDPASARVSSWESLAASQQWSVAALMRRAILRSSPSPQGFGLSLSPGGDIAALLGSQYTPDFSYAKHGYLQKLGRSLFAGLLSDSNASADPTSPFYDPRAAIEQSTAAAATSPYNRWLTRFYRTDESASGRACLVSYRNREETRPSGKRKHVLQLFEARVFDLAAIRAQVEEEVRGQAEAEERERWRRKAETRGTVPGTTGKYDGEENIYAHERGPQRRARLAALARAVQAAFVSHRSFPEALPDFSPSGEADFAIYVRTPAPRFLFFRTSTSREKVKWIAVLRNLSADQGALHRPMSTPLDSPLRGLVASSLAPPGGEEPAFDEREVHVSVRDLYAILGVEPRAPAQMITRHYRELQAELRARLLPLSPLHSVVPSLPEPAESADADAEEEVEERGKTKGKGKARAGLPLVPRAQPFPTRHQRVFSFDVGAAPRMQTMAATDPGAASAASSSVPSDDGAPSPSPPSPAPLSVEQVQQRIRFKLSELREVWRILKDPVRRCQYDERREALGLAELGRLRSPLDEAVAPGSEASPPKLDSGTPALSTPRSAPNENGRAARAGEDPSAAAQAVDLDLVLQRAQQNAAALPLAHKYRAVAAAAAAAAQPAAFRALNTTPRPRRPSVPGAGVRAKETEEKYPAPDEKVQAEEKQQQARQPFTSPTISVLSPSPPPPSTGPAPPPPPAAPPLLPSLRLVSPKGALTAAPWAPGDRFTVRWDPEWGRHTSGAAAAPATPGAPKGKPPQPPPLSSLTATQSPPPPNGHVRLELLLRRGLGFLSRVTLVKVIAERAQDTGWFSFELPADLAPRRGYFVRLTLLPYEDGAATTSSASKAVVTTESPPFEVALPPVVKTESRSEAKSAPPPSAAAAAVLPTKQS